MNDPRKNPRFFDLNLFVPDLAERFQKNEVELNEDSFVHVMLPVENPETHKDPVQKQENRQDITIRAGEKIVVWRADSLRSLFRGDAKPPVLGPHPEAYQEIFALFDLHVHDLSQLFGCPRDAELEEAFTALRKRPDGRSLGYLHDHLWRACALVLATRPLSAAEFEAIIARLEKSMRTFAQGSTSRNFAETILRIHSRPSARDQVWPG